MSVAPESHFDCFIPISAATLARGTNYGVDIYARINASDAPILLCSADQQIPKEKLDAVSLNGKLLIHCDNRDRYQSFLRENYRDCIADECVPVADRVSILNDVIRDVLADQFANGTTESIVETCHTLGQDSVTILGSESVVPNELCKVLHHDYGTFTHSANVSAYAVLLARGLGYSKTDLEQIATGALLHDLGKLDISDQILNKPGKLTDAEFALIKKHPTTGLQRVGDRTDLNYGQLMMIYQHHERINGTGYPVGCSADEIHPWGKICAIVDVFEALTSHRPYRVPFTHPTAFAVLERGSGSEFDKEMLECWRQLLSL